MTTNDRPERFVTDQYRVTLKAVKQLVKQNYLSRSAHQCFKYRNNLIEQDHRFIKRHRIHFASFHSFQAISAALSDVKIVHVIRKKKRRAVSLIGFSVVDELETLIAA